MLAARCIGAADGALTQALRQLQLCAAACGATSAHPGPHRHGSPLLPLRQLSSSAPTQSGAPGGHVFDEHDVIVGGYSPVTKRLWQQRYRWTEERLAAAAPRDPEAAAQQGKPPARVRVAYSFAADPITREHYRNPWGEARIGRLLEDLDSLAGYVAFAHSDDGDPSTRPPLLVTATVEAIQLRGRRLTLDQDMEMSGRVVWTGSSSMDIAMELEQGGQPQLTALFTFVARDAVTGKPVRLPPVLPQTPQDQALFDERACINAERKAARKATSDRLHEVSPEGEQWARQLLAAAKTKSDLPALADSNMLLMDDTSLENTFTCQPEHRNMHGRVFGGFLMRRAFELAHSTAYLFAGCRPRTVEVNQIRFRRPVNVGDLIRFRSWVIHTWPSQLTPGKGVMQVSVEASVMQPEQLQSMTTNTFGFRFVYDLKQDAVGHHLPPKQVLPSTEQQALEVAQQFGPGAQQVALAAGAVQH